MSAKHPPSQSTPQGRVLVTRPAAQSAELVDALQLAGWQVQALPMLVVEPLLAQAAAPDLRSVFAAGAAAAAQSIAIFISANAVHCSAELLLAQRLQWPSYLHCSGIGEATLAAIEAQGWPLLPLPEAAGDEAQSRRGQRSERQGSEGQGSEALLARLQSIDLARARVLVFSGQGGRQTLQRGLAARGAQVQRIETYRRLRPDYSPEVFAQSMHSFLHGDATQGGRSGRARFMPVMLFASAETVENFCFFARASAYWQQLVELPALLPSARVAGAAAALGLCNTVVAGNASTQAFLRTLASLPGDSRCKL